MAKISSEDRHHYLIKIKPYREVINRLLKTEEEALARIKENPEGAALKRVALAEDMFDLVSNYIVLNDVSQVVLKIRNEEALDAGRKTMYRGIIYLEQTVGNLVDAPFSEYEEKVAELEPLDAARRYRLARKMGLCLDLLENAYGDNTKWKWSFVEVEGRLAVAVKNILNLKNALANRDPRSPDYEPTQYHLRLIKMLLAQAADRYRDMYHLSTNRLEDLKMGLKFLEALRRIHALLGEREEAELVKKKYDAWFNNLELDIRKQKELLKKDQDERNLP
jgi:hypothetical protein